MTPAEESKSGEKRLSDDINVLEAEVAQLTMELERTKLAVREMMAAEDPKNGEIQFRTNKINRINLGISDMEPSEGLKNGFLF
jgi:hypothetical protein